MRKRPALISIGLCCCLLSRCDCQSEKGVGSLKPVMVVTPESLDFGEVFIGDIKLGSIEVSNQGTLVLELTEIKSEDGSSPDFILGAAALQPGSKFVEPGGKFTVGVTYKPGDEGADAGAVLISGSDKSNPRARVPLSGNGKIKPTPKIDVCVGGTQCLEPLEVDFGLTAVGERKTEEVLVKSVGALDLDVFEADLQAVAGTGMEFILDPTPFTMTLPSGESAVLKVTYAPTDGGNDDGSVFIKSNDPDRPQVEVRVKGQGDGPKLCPEPPITIDFGSVSILTTATKSASFRSCGTKDLDVTRIGLANGSSPDFTLTQAPQTPITYAPGESFTIEVQYKPAEVGRDEGRVEIESNDPDTPLGWIGLRGEGTQGPICNIDLMPRILNFGTVPANQSADRSFLIVNIGEQKCSVSGISIGAGGTDYSIVTAPRTPFDLDPGISIEVMVRYTPVNPQGMVGRADVQSSDVAEPTASVELRGNQGAQVGCQLEANPPVLNFGDVRVGRSSALGTTVTNTGGERCLISVIKLTPNTPMTFSVTDAPRVPELLAVGRSVNIEITYKPSGPGTQTGALDIKEGLTARNGIQVQVLGRGAGPLLCADPRAVDFGVVNVGTTIEKELALINCGTETLSLNSATIPAGVTPEFDISRPFAPSSLDPQQRYTLYLSYTPANLGRDDGKVVIESSDPVEPSKEVPLLGVGANPNDRCGNVFGRICGTEGYWLSNARVWVDAGGQVYETRTDADGYFTLTCVPAGNQTVHAQAGSWRVDFQAQVVDRQTTVIAEPQCVNIDDIKVAVTWGEWDTIQANLDHIGVPYDLYSEEAGGGTNDMSADLLTDRGLLMQYDIVILNCGMIEAGLVTDPSVQQNLRDFVNAGHSLFASDYAYDYIEQTWPNAADFGGDDDVVDSAQDAPSETVTGILVDPALVRLFNANTITLNFGLSPLTMVDAVDPATFLQIRGDRLNDGNDRKPLMFMFSTGPNSGHALYTSFHVDEQEARYGDMLFNYIIFNL